jgi:hypothetical protein
MSKLIGSVAVVLLLAVVNPAREKYAKYKSIEAYEIRPGILMMPRYSADGQVCEIGLEKLHYSTEKIMLDSSLSRQAINQIFDELVPSDERGPRPQNPIARGMDYLSGNSWVSDEEYENVSIQIYGGASSASKTGTTADGVAATLKWKNRKCQ